MASNVGKSRAQQNRQIRQDELRKYMQERGSVQHLFDCLEKLAQLDHSSDGAQFELTKLDKVIGHRMKLMDKYLPTLKSTELDIQGELDHVHDVSIEVVKALKAKYDTE